MPEKTKSYKGSLRWKKIKPRYLKKNFSQMKFPKTKPQPTPPSPPPPKKNNLSLLKQETTLYVKSSHNDSHVFCFCAVPGHHISLKW